jgi:hypothetical protein
MNELIKALKSLISDIESMQSSGTHDSNWFGPFSQHEMGLDDLMEVEWPNLAISLEAVKAALENFEKLP